MTGKNGVIQPTLDWVKIVGFCNEMKQKLMRVRRSFILMYFCCTHLSFFYTYSSFANG